MVLNFGIIPLRTSVFSHLFKYCVPLYARNTGYVLGLCVCVHAHYRSPIPNRPSKNC